MDPLLYGWNTETGIIAAHHHSDNSIRLYRRSSSGITSSDHELYPFFHLSDSRYLSGFEKKHWIKKLSGKNYFQFICAFRSWSHMWEAVHFILDRYNREADEPVDSYLSLPVIHLRTDAVSQFLLQSGMTLFKQMEFADLHRLQIDIETYSKPGFKFSNPQREDDKIIIIALSDNRGWEHILEGKSLSEREMLLALVDIILEKDPDIIEGHNIYNFDLPYILTRCKLREVDFAVGRDGSPPRSFESRIAFAERSFDYTSHEITGRHIIDTWLLLQGYDVSKRTLESYGLKYAARHFGFASSDRSYVEPTRIPWYWDHEPDQLIRYALDDVRETRQLSDLLSPSSFYLTQLIPMSYGATARTGSSAKIELLLLRSYLKEKHSVPRPSVGLQTTGGYTDVFYSGVLGPVIDVDVESLYPSIMITKKIVPRSDELGIFSHILSSLTTTRLDTKRQMKQTADIVERSRLDAMQSSLKILINSFYGYLGYSRALFNDPEAADVVTTTGQSILRNLITTIEEYEGQVIEVDTDGIFFVPPKSVHTESDEEDFVRRIASTLPKGIHLAMDGRFKRMLSYKMKNYALLGYDNRIKIKGSSLNSRGIENFGRQFIRSCIEALLHGDVEKLHTLYIDLHKNIAERKLAMTDFVRTETLKDSLETYSGSVLNGRRNRTASYEVALANGIDWKPGDKISYYITGTNAGARGFENCKSAEEWNSNNPDENTAYYLKKLDEFATKFEPYFTPSDFRSIFSVDDMFGFTAAGIKIITEVIERKETGAETRKTGRYSND